MQLDNPKVSICICNRNMADTLEMSVTSILNQIDQRFEVLVVDDGSTDNSVEILEHIQRNFSNFRYFSIARDKKRKLGFTRNISIEHATGEWVVLHLDTDDKIDNGLVKFVEDVLRINEVDSTPALYSGHQIHMAPRKWLLTLGPNRNLYRLEDRDLYQRLIPSGQWRIIEHDRFISRLKRDRRRSLKKTTRDAFEHLISDTRYCDNFIETLRKEVSRKSAGKIVLKFYRLISLPFAYKIGRGLGKIETSIGDFSDHGVRLYRETNTRNVNEWCDFLYSLK